MSRTDVHRPWRVQVADPYNRHILRLLDVSLRGPFYTSYRNIGCGCPMCTGKFERRAERRRDRHEVKQRLRKGSEE